MQKIFTIKAQKVQHPRENASIKQVPRDKLENTTFNRPAAKINLSMRFATSTIETIQNHNELNANGKPFNYRK